MKKPLIYVLAVSALSVILYASCSKNNETFAPDASVSSFELENGPGEHPPVIPSFEPVFAVSFSDESILYLFQNEHDSNTYIATYHEEQYDVVYDQESNLVRGLKNNRVFFEHEPPSNEAPNGWPGDCDLLGARKENESYEDCYSRNFDNFCCDFTSCASFALFPIPVMAAIGYACLLPGRPLDIDRILNLRTGREVYNRNNKN